MTTTCSSRLNKLRDLIPLSWQQALVWEQRPEFATMTVPGRLDSDGAAFNFAEVVVTRASCTTAGADGITLRGYGYILGRDKGKSESVAILDTALQAPDLASILDPAFNVLEAELDAEAATRAAAIRRTQVRFQTLAREGDPAP